VAIKGQYPNVEAVTIYGELFGGLEFSRFIFFSSFFLKKYFKIIGVYEHPNITSIPGVIPVQREIQYSPNLHFKAFDILVIANQGEKSFFFFKLLNVRT